ncbi:MAG: nitrilase family protein [Chitinophagaceae bacterium]|jgi:predicted amidohydrolase|nr:nitrilase family protein [Chitinophagaceae bacterium]
MSDLTCTLIQTNIFWENKDANLEMFSRKIKSIGQKTELVILPEMFSTGFSMQPEQLAETTDGSTMQWMRQVAKEQRIVLAGSIIIKENNCFFNRLIWMLPTGEYGYYDKRHLFAFAGEDKHYTSGNGRLITSVKGWKINLQICYDLRFPVWARQTPDNEHKFEYDLLINVANWSESRRHTWETLLQARAIENQCYAIGVNRVGVDDNNIVYSGDSCVINPMGEKLYTKNNAEDIFTITLKKETLNKVRDTFPFNRDADIFFITM